MLFAGWLGDRSPRSGSFASGHNGVGTMEEVPKVKLYVLPWALYSRRVIICLKKKVIPDKFEITPVEITRDGMPASEVNAPRPVLILDIDNGQHIFQSSAILKYLKDKFPHAPDMRGITLEAAARVRELMDLVNEACFFLGTYMHNISKLMEGLGP